MTTSEEFAAAFPIEVQLRAERNLREFWQAKAEAAEKRRIPPERKELEEMQRQLAIKERVIQSERDNIAVWKKVADQLSARVDAIADGTDIPRLERERDGYKQRWERAVQRIGVLLEHQGSVELLEAELAARDGMQAISALR